MGKKRQRRRKSRPGQREEVGSVAVEQKEPRQQLHTEGARQLQKSLGKNLERAFRGLDVPDEVKRNIVRVEKHLRDFESAVATTEDIYSEAGSDIVETLLVMGAFTNELRHDVERLFQSYGKWLVNEGQRIHSSTYDRLMDRLDGPPSARDQARINERCNAAVTKFWKKYEQTINSYHDRIEQSGRPLLALIGREANMAAEVIEMREMIRDRVQEATSDIPPTNLLAYREAARQATAAKLDEIQPDEPSPSMQYNSLITWNRFAHVSKYMDVRIEDDAKSTLRPDMVHQWIQNVDFEPSEEREEFVIEGITTGGRKLIGRLITSKDLNALSVAGFEISVEGVEKSTTAGEISRLTSDLSPNGLFYMSMRDIFEGAKVGNMYERIREEVLKAVYRKYEREQVPPGDRETLRDLLSEDPSVFGALPTEEEDGLTSWEEATLDVEDLGAEQDQFEIDDAPAETELPPPPPTPPVVPPKKFTLPSEEPERIAARPRERRPEQRNKLSIKKVKQKLIRLGAEVFTKKGDHPHFVGPSGKRVRFYNDHSSQRGRVLKGAQIRRVVEALGYTMEQFWAA